MLPLRNQAYDDDFAYVQTVQNFYHTGNLEISEWSAVSMIFPAFWGLFFFKMFGPYITSLHFSNILLFYFALIIFYKLLKLLKLDDFRSFIFTLFLLGFPWIFNFVYSFMSDSFYLSLTIFSLYFIIKGLKSDNFIYLSIGSLLTGLAFLTRQIGVSLMFGLFFIYLYQFLVLKKINLLKSFFTFIPFIIIFLLYTIRVKLTGPTAAYASYVVYPVFNDFLPRILPFQLGQASITNSLYLEIFIQRITAYVNTLVGFSLPLFLIYKIKLNQIKLLFKQNLTTILVLTLSFSLLYLIDFYLKNKFTSTFSAMITRYDTLFIDWAKLWPFVIILTLPFWIITLSIWLKESTHLIINRSPKRKIFNVLFLIEIIATFLSLILIYINMFPKEFVYKPLKSGGNIFSNLFNTFYQIIFSNKLLEVLTNTWFMYIILISTITLSLYLITHKKITTINKNQLLILYLSLVLLFKLFFVLFFASFFWEQYIIQFFVILYILIIYTFKNLNLNKKLAFALAILTIVFSVNLTRIRYQTTGIRWEGGTLLVESGVNPYYVEEAGWAWRPYHFFDRTFKQTLLNSKIDKYQQARKKFSNWTNGTISGPLYSFVDIEINKPIPSELQNKVILTSKPYWVIKNRTIQWYKTIVIKDVTNIK